MSDFRDALRSWGVTKSYLSESYGTFFARCEGRPGVLRRRAPTDLMDKRPMLRHGRNVLWTNR